MVTSETEQEQPQHHPNDADHPDVTNTEVLSTAVIHEAADTTIDDEFDQELNRLIEEECRPQLTEEMKLLEEKDKCL